MTSLLHDPSLLEAEAELQRLALTPLQTLTPDIATQVSTGETLAAEESQYVAQCESCGLHCSNDGFVASSSDLSFIRSI